MDRFVPYIRPHVPGCPDEWIRRELSMAAIEFCESSLICAEEVPVEIQEGAVSVMVSSPGDTRIIHIENLGKDGMFSSGKVHKGKAVLELAQPASENARTKILVCLAPGQDTRTFPNILFDEWMEEITAGALSRLMTMPGRNWYHPGMAALHQSAFLHGKGQAAIVAHKRNHSDMTVRQKPWV